MKLECAARGGSNVLALRPALRHGVVQTEPLVAHVFRERIRYLTRDLAYSVEEYLARSLAELAVEEASNLGCKTIGFTGGVAYNEHFVNALRSVTEAAGMRLVTNRLVPRGDGGVSFGQAIAAVHATR